MAVIFRDWFSTEGIACVDCRYIQLHETPYVVVDSEQDFKWLVKLHQLKCVYRREMDKWVKYYFFTTKGYCVQFNYPKEVVSNG